MKDVVCCALTAVVRERAFLEYVNVAEQRKMWKACFEQGRHGE